MEINDVLLGLVVGCQWVFLGVLALMVIEAVTAASNAVASLPPQSIVKVSPVTLPVKSPAKKASATQLMALTKVQLHELCVQRNLKRKSAYSKRELVDYLLQS